MKFDSKKHHRILAVAPSSRGFGYALLEGEKLANWGSSPANKDKNAKCVMKVEELILRFKPEAMVLEDTGGENSRRHMRIRDLSQSLLALSLSHKVPVTWFRQEQVLRFFLGKAKGTKQEIAELIGERFREDLGIMVPPKRKTWANQDYRMDIFDAVALALILRQGAGGQLQKPERTND